MHDPANGLRRVSLPRTPVNKGKRRAGIKGGLPALPLLALFTGVRGIGILGSPFARSCIDRPPGGVSMASRALHAVRWRVYILWC